MSVFQAGDFESNVIAALRDFIAVTSNTTLILAKFLQTDSDFQSRKVGETPRTQRTKTPRIRRFLSSKGRADPQRGSHTDAADKDSFDSRFAGYPESAINSICKRRGDTTTWSNRQVLCRLRRTPVTPLSKRSVKITAWLC